MAMNFKYKEIDLGDGILYCTVRNMDANLRAAFVAGFNGKPINARPNSSRDIYHLLGRRLRAQFDAGELVVRQADNRLVPAGLEHLELI